MTLLYQKVLNIPKLGKLVNMLYKKKLSGSDESPYLDTSHSDHRSKSVPIEPSSTFYVPSIRTTPLPFSSSKNNSSLLRQALTNKYVTSFSQNQPWEHNGLDIKTMMEWVANHLASPHKTSDSGKLFFMFSSEGTPSVEACDYAIITNVTAMEIQILSVLDLANIPVPSFKKTNQGLLMEWVSGITISFDKFATFDTTLFKNSIESLFKDDREKKFTIGTVAK